MELRCVFLSFLVFAGYCCAASPHDNRADDGWIDFKHQYKKSYSSDVEEDFRRSVFHENQQKIAEHNEKYEAGDYSYKLKINQFGDMLFEEYKNYMHPDNKTMARFRRMPRGERFDATTAISDELPDFVDWREQGAVTPVQDQGLTCGSCWAFSATGALEGQYFKKTGVLRVLSAQSLIDCTLDYGNLGCGGGSAALAFQYVVDRKGLASEDEYPYVGSRKDCPFDLDEDDDVEASFVYVPPTNETALKIAVATVGPLSVAIDASHDTFRFYSEGIYYQSECDKADLDHAVLVVGYGTDSKDRDYWLVKNSWGESWGEVGYFKVARNQHNHCGIATVALYPIV